LKAAGNQVTAIIGARSKELLILENEMKHAAHRLIVTTDDGSYGIHGLVTKPLADMMNRGERIDRVFCIGPVPMMRAVAELTRPQKISTIVSLNPVMVDGTGMCGGCRVTIGGKVKFACVDGPDFDAHEVDFDELVRRQQMYRSEEKEALERYAQKRNAGVME
jgi:ferredoxin--NADP+ reductase